MRKLLYSPKYGAGWSTWCSNPSLVKFMVSYRPIIDFLESGNKFEWEDDMVRYDENDQPLYDKLHPVLREFAEACYRQFDEIPYLGGAQDLEVLVVPDDELVRFDEYDGYESYELRSQVDNHGWL